MTWSKNLWACFFMLLLMAGGMLVSCNSKQQKGDVLFELLAPEKTGITFRNDLAFDKDFNIFTYRNFYNGGGVGIGDFNNDGLPDIYFTGNQTGNALYLNKGNFTFEDITAKAGVGGTRAWSTGVAVADVNGDGWLDIYVCNSGDIKGDYKQNELFINNGDLTFIEQAEAYGLADQGFSTHAVFFDYDRDGDLDVYLLNNSYQAIGSFNMMQNIRHIRDEVGGDKLYRNDNNHFTDVSEEAGIYGSIIGFGLGITIGDVNNDGWPDIFISNDFFERDYLYINNRDGTFTESLTSSMPSISAASMGADIADVNNDGLLDIFVTDMLPEDDYRLKQITTFENWDKFTYNYSNGYHYQLTRNMLHLNNGDGTFSDIGRLAGVSATDWSWGALFVDMDNDGLKDIFVANGIYQDITDLDYLTFIADESTIKKIVSKQGVDYASLIKPIPVNPVPNYAFQNQGNLRFSNRASDWGLGQAVHSNGAAYADLDNDGALDLIVNNVNNHAFVYRNTLQKKLGDQGFIRFTLLGENKNTSAIGTRLILKAGDDTFLYEQMPNRGFQSSVDPVITAGVGKHKVLESIQVIWPDGRETVLANVAVNTALTLRQSEGSEVTKSAAITAGRLTNITGNGVLTFKHEENTFIDFDRDRLTYHMLSTLGPKMAMGDVNGDGLEDVYIGGAKDRPGKIFLQQSSGNFSSQNQIPFEADAGSEDVDAAFFDIDQDGDLDLYVASGGNEFTMGAPQLIDRVYLNDGKGMFSRSQQPALASHSDVSGTVAVSDVNGDGYPDVFVGNRVKTFFYGLPADGVLYLNDGKGVLKDATSTHAPELLKLGMMADALFMDYDGDGDDDLFIVGEWMTIEVFQNNTGLFKRVTNEAGLSEYAGWWNVIRSADLDNDGDFDLIIGNHGENSRFKASPENPLYLYVSDFDNNGSIEHIFARSIKGKVYPYTLKHELIAQLAGLKKKYLKYESYNTQTVQQIFSPEELNKATAWKATHMQTSVLINEGNGRFTLKSLPVEAQFAPVYAILPEDLDRDGIPDLLLGGNLYEVKPEAGRYDASYGVWLKGKGNGEFINVPQRESGFVVNGAIRDIQSIISPASHKRIIVAVNNQPVNVFELR
jgi:enediyne biosynthesis protein E4